MPYINFKKQKLHLNITVQSYVNQYLIILTVIWWQTPEINPGVNLFCLVISVLTIKAAAKLCSDRQILYILYIKKQLMLGFLPIIYVFTYKKCFK